MAMAPGNQAIVGGTVLRIPAIQSPDYVPGQTGWIIRQDGSAEFNAGTFRGSIEVGSLTGQHFWVNNPSTGDVIDVYNSANKLVFSIDATGRVVSTSSVSTAEVVIAGANLLFEDSAQNPIQPPFANGTLAAGATSMNLTAGQPANYTGSGQGAFITLSTGTTTGSEQIAAEQRGIQGTLVMTDTSNVNQLVHAAMISCTTNASGDGTSNHGCSFTPTVINATCSPTSFTQQGVTCMIWRDLTTSTHFSYRILTSTGNPFTGTMNVMFTFWG